MVTLGHPTVQDKEALHGILGTRVLPTNAESNETTCPDFEGVVLRRRVAESVIVPLQDSTSSLIRVALLFNATHMSDITFTAQTGIWMEGGLVHVIYCEYNSKKPENYDNNKKSRSCENFSCY